jgi:hypothetical protein
MPIHATPVSFGVAISMAGEPTTIGSQPDDEPVDGCDGLWADHAAEVEGIF